MNSSFSVDDEEGSSIFDDEDDYDSRTNDAAGSSVSSSSSVVLVLRDDTMGVDTSQEEEEEESGGEGPSDQYVPFVVGSVPLYLATGDDGKPVYIRRCLQPGVEGMASSSNPKQEMSFGGFSDNSDSTFEGFGPLAFEGFEDDSCENNGSQFDGFSEDSAEIVGGKQKIEYIRNWQKASQCYNNLDLDTFLGDSNDGLSNSQPSTFKESGQKTSVEQSPEVSHLKKSRRGKQHHENKKVNAVTDISWSNVIAGGKRKLRDLRSSSPKAEQTQQKSTPIQRKKAKTEVVYIAPDLDIKEEIEIKEEEEHIDYNEFIGVHCNDVGCTISWLESMKTKFVTVTQGMVFELDEFAKRINWEKVHVAKWILRLRGILNVEPTEKDMEKIHMVVRRRKALMVTLACTKKGSIRLQEFDTSEFTLPSDIKKELGEVIVEDVEHSSRSVGGEADAGQAWNASSWGSNVAKGRVKKFSIIRNLSGVQTKKDSRKSALELGNIRQEDDLEIGEIRPSGAFKSRERRTSDESQLSLSKSGVETRKRSGQQIDEQNSDDSPKKFKKTTDSDSRVSFYCMGNRVYPFFHESDEALGKHCREAGLTVSDLNAWVDKDVQITQGVVVELYRFYRDRGCTVTALAQRLLQLKNMNSVNLISMIVKITTLLKKVKSTRGSDFYTLEFHYPKSKKDGESSDDKFKAPGWECKVKPRLPIQLSEVSSPHHFLEKDSNWMANDKSSGKEECGLKPPQRGTFTEVGRKSGRLSLQRRSLAMAAEVSVGDSRSGKLRIMSGDTSVREREEEDPVELEKVKKTAAGVDSGVGKQKRVLRRLSQDKQKSMNYDLAKKTEISNDELVAGSKTKGDAGSESGSENKFDDNNCNYEDSRPRESDGDGCAMFKGENIEADGEKRTDLGVKSNFGGESDGHGNLGVKFQMKVKGKVKHMQRDILANKWLVSDGIFRGGKSSIDGRKGVEIRRSERERTLSTRVKEFHSVSEFFEEDKEDADFVRPNILPDKLPERGPKVEERKPEPRSKRKNYAALGECSGLVKQYLNRDDPRVSFSFIDGRIIPHFKDVNYFLGDYCQSAGLTIADLNSSEPKDVVLTKGAIVELVNFYRLMGCTMTSLADRLLRMKKICLGSILNLVARFGSIMKYEGRKGKMLEEFLFPPGDRNALKLTPNCKNPKIKNESESSDLEGNKESMSGETLTYACKVPFKDSIGKLKKKKKKQKIKQAGKAQAWRGVMGIKNIGDMHKEGDQLTSGTGDVSMKGGRGVIFSVEESERIGAITKKGPPKVSEKIYTSMDKKDLQKTPPEVPLGKRSDQCFVDREVEKAKGKEGSVTRADIVLLYAKWLKNKNEVGSSVFVTDLLQDVVKLMEERKVQMIRIPAGTLMSSSVKLYEEYRRMWSTSKADAMMYLEEDWLEDIQYLVSITQTSRRNTTEMNEGESSLLHAEETKAVPVQPEQAKKLSGERNLSDLSSEKSLRIDESFSDGSDMDDFSEPAAAIRSRSNASKTRMRPTSRKRSLSNNAKKVNTPVANKKVPPAAAALVGCGSSCSPKEIEEIVDYKFIVDKNSKGQISYLVRFKGYGSDDDEWVNEKSLKCPRTLNNHWRGSVSLEGTQGLLQWQPFAPNQREDFWGKFKTVEAGKEFSSTSRMAKCSTGNKVNDKENSPHNFPSSRSKVERSYMTNGELLCLYDNWRQENLNSTSKQSPPINAKSFTERVAKVMSSYGMKTAYSNFALQACFVLTLIRKMLGSEEALREFLGKDCMPALESSCMSQENNQKRCPTKMEVLSGNFMKLKTDFRKARETRLANLLRIRVAEDEVERVERALNRARGQPQFLGGALRQEINKLGKNLSRLKQGEDIHLAKDFRIANPGRYGKTCSDMLECGVPESNVETIMDSVMKAIGKFSNDFRESKDK